MTNFTGTNLEYEALKAGDSKTWKFFSRIENGAKAVCLISRITGDKKNCKKILATTSSSDKVIFHFNTYCSSVAKSENNLRGKYNNPSNPQWMPLNFVFTLDPQEQLPE